MRDRTSFFRDVIQRGLLFLLFIAAPLLFSGETLFYDDVVEEKCMRGECVYSQEEEESLKMCISFSMPEEALLFFSKELEYYGGSFVFRGIPNNSFPEFFKQIKRLRDLGLQAPISIDPDLFEKFSIDGVPTLLLMSEEGVDRLVGNVPIRDSLEKFSFLGDSQQLAKALLKGK
ncbi:MAG: type-F conjugative transfer system pilin assembly protein TrbC [Chlamydiia bacterium]|nr:type-F conjugative transfer system pilin assembly protein TrbC [Chlamydiia bacterium]